MVATAAVLRGAAIDAQLFVVHVWRQRTRFRAAVRRVDSDERLTFSTPAGLARYLAAVSREPANEPGAAQRGTGPEAEAKES